MLPSHRFSITYENGAEVSTSFVTNMDRAKVRSCPDLHKAVREANEQVRRAATKQMPKYSYPDHIITAAILS